METPYSINGQYGGTFQRLDGEVSGHTFDMSDLDNCEVLLLDYSDQVNVTDVRNSRVFIGACSATVVARRCNNCTFTVATRDFKAIECRDCYFFLFTANEPKLQKSDRIELGPFNGAYAELEHQLITAALDGKVNNWWRVQDYDADDLTPTAHFKLLSQDEYHEQCEPWLPFGPCDYAVPVSWPPDDVASGLDSVVSSRTPPSLDSYGSGGGIGTGGGGAAAPLANNHYHSNSSSSNNNPPESTADILSPDQEWRIKWEDSLKKRAEKEKQTAKEARSKAEEWLDSFYDQRTDLKAHRMAKNREQEEYTLQRLRDAEAEENSFSRVLSLVDVADKGHTSADMSRFRGLLIQLKDSDGMTSQPSLAGENSEF